MINRNDMTHPRNHPCSRCGAKPGEFCRSSNGKAIIGVERQHAVRHRCAKLARA